MNCCRNCIYCRPLTRRGVVIGQMCDNNNSDNDGLEVSQWDTCDQFEGVPWLGTEGTGGVRMDDLISRQAAIDAIVSKLDSIDHVPQWVFDELTNVMEELPSAQPERELGRWVHDGYDHPHGVDWMHCSECGRRDAYVPAAKTNYCPNCGAKMDSGKVKEEKR